ncbi:MAG: hypothetical protein K5979_14790 [Ruminococcus sp.]|nr:hypothetical protein [Ruminococcus sp.]
MKHTKKTALTAAVLSAAVSLSSCNGGDDLQTVYGPPQYEPSSENVQEVYGPPEIAETTEPSSNTAQTETTEISTSETSAGTTVTDTDSEDAIPKDIQLVYGPPNDIN